MPLHHLVEDLDNETMEGAGMETFDATISYLPLKTRLRFILDNDLLNSTIEK